MIINPGVRQTILFGGTQLSAAAKTIITAIESRKGSAMTSAQRKAIDTFIRAETAAGRWGTVIKRFFLPGWANASANAYDWVTGAVGTFSGVVDHTTTPGVVQGNGSSGYFDFGATPSSIGITVSSGSIFALCTQAASGTSPAGIVNSVDGSDLAKTFFLDHLSSAALQFSANTLAGAVTALISRSNQVGVIIGTREGGARRIHQRRASGFSTLTNTVGSDSGTVPTARTLQCMRSTYAGGGSYSDGRYGCFGAGIGLTTADAEAFSANLKTLWETLFGLTLP